MNTTEITKTTKNKTIKNFDKSNVQDYLASLTTSDSLIELGKFTRKEKRHLTSNNSEILNKIKSDITSLTNVLTDNSISDYNLNISLTKDDSNNNIITLKSSALYGSQILKELPTGYINKVACGSGFTTVALENDKNVVIAMPTKVLIDNKVAQYPNDRVDYKLFGVYGKVTKSQIDDYVYECIQANKPFKILVTYDSIYKLQKYFNMTSLETKLIIDESNKLIFFTKLKNKSLTHVSEKSVIDNLYEFVARYKDRVSFISATPVPIRLLPKNLQSLPQYRFEWEKIKPIKPITVKVKYPMAYINNKIIYPLMNHGAIVTNNDTIFTKAIIFINSLTDIMKIINKNKLYINDVSIIASNTARNKRTAYPYNISTTGEVKKYTFCTSVAYDGIDLNSEDALTVGVSSLPKNKTINDTISYTLMLKEYDLIQAFSRNRNRNNPFFGSGLFLYNHPKTNLTQNKITEIINKKRQSLIKLHTDLNHKIKNLKEDESYDDLLRWYKHDFISYTIDTNNNNKRFKVNENLFEIDKFISIEKYKSLQSFYGDNAINISEWDNTGIDILPTYLKKKETAIKNGESYYINNNIEFKKYSDFFKKNNYTFNGIEKFKGFDNVKYKLMIEYVYTNYKKVFKTFVTTQKYCKDLNYARQHAKDYKSSLVDELLKVAQPYKSNDYIIAIKDFHYAIENFKSRFHITDNITYKYSIKVFSEFIDNKRVTIYSKIKNVSAIRFEVTSIVYKMFKKYSLKLPDRDKIISNNKIVIVESVVEQYYKHLKSYNRNKNIAALIKFFKEVDRKMHPDLITDDLIRNYYNTYCKVPEIDYNDENIILSEKQRKINKIKSTLNMNTKNIDIHSNI